MVVNLVSSYDIFIKIGLFIVVNLVNKNCIISEELKYLQMELNNLRRFYFRFSIIVYNFFSTLTE